MPIFWSWPLFMKFYVQAISVRFVDPLDSTTVVDISRHCVRSRSLLSCSLWPRARKQAETLVMIQYSSSAGGRKLSLLRICNELSPSSYNNPIRLRKPCVKLFKYSREWYYVGEVERPSPLHAFLLSYVSLISQVTYYPEECPVAYLSCPYLVPYFIMFGIDLLCRCGSIGAKESKCGNVLSINERGRDIEMIPNQRCKKR